MKFGIYTNLTRDIGGHATKKLFRLLKENKKNIVLSAELAGLKLDAPLLNNENLAKASDILFVLGGDGTILRIATECAEHGASIFAVNLGHKGFLSEKERNVDLKDTLEKLERGEYYEDVRAMIKVLFNGKNYYALNDIVISRGNVPRMLTADIYVQGGRLDRYHSDGIIVSTPTGSTAYSLSAGGPILAPDVPAMVLVPICAHSIGSRPVVVSDKNEIKICVSEGQTAAVSVDGMSLGESKKEEIIIRKSKLTIKFIRLDDFNFYEKLLGKMRYWNQI